MEQLKLHEILFWEVHQKPAEKNEFGDNGAKNTLRVVTCMR